MDYGPPYGNILIEPSEILACPLFQTKLSKGIQKLENHWGRVRSNVSDILL